jgi:SAM-dependent methyltransferase
MANNLIHQYYDYYLKHYFSRNIFSHYPEAKYIPQYLQQHFSTARIVLDLGFGTGLWFWASFLPSLERLDGIDMYPQALKHANEVFEKKRTPSGWRKAHQNIGEAFSLADIRRLKRSCGNYYFSDYRNQWPGEIQENTYDLITEHGGGLAQVESREALAAVTQNIAKALAPGGDFFFMNLEMEPDEVEKKLGNVEEKASVDFTHELFLSVARRANLVLKEFARIENIVFGYMRRE